MTQRVYAEQIMQLVAQINQLVEQAEQIDQHKEGANRTYEEVIIAASTLCLYVDEAISV